MVSFYGLCALVTKPSVKRKEVKKEYQYPYKGSQNSSNRSLKREKSHSKSKLCNNWGLKKKGKEAKRRRSRGDRKLPVFKNPNKEKAKTHRERYDLG